MLGSFRVVYDPPIPGVKIIKIAIVPERGARSFRPCSTLFWYVFPRESHPSHPTASTFAVLADQDALWAFFCSCAWHSLSPCLVLCSHVLGIDISGLMTPVCYVCCGGRPYTPISVWGPDLLLGHSRPFAHVQGVLGIVGPFVCEGFHAFLRIQSVHLSLYRCFPLNLSPPLQRSIPHFSTRLKLFLGGLYLGYMLPKSLVVRCNDRYVTSISVFHPHPKNSLDAPIVSVALRVISCVGKGCYSYIRCYIFILALYIHQ